MALVISNLSFKLSANAAALKKDFDQAGKSIQDLGGAADQAGADFGGIAERATEFSFALNQIAEAATLVIDKLSQLATPARDFNTAMAASMASMKGLTDAIRGDMVSAAQQAAFDTKASMTQAAEAYGFLAAAGLDAARSLKAMPVVARFAQAGLFDLALATDLLTDAQSAMGLSSTNAQEHMQGMIRTADNLAAAKDLANASIQQFSEALTGGAAASARNFSQSIEDALAVLAAFADQGTKGADAGTKYSIALRDLTTKAITNAAAFEDMKIKVYDAGQVRPMLDIIRDLEQAFGDMTPEVQKAALMQLGFADKSVGAIQMLLGTSESIARYREELGKAAGTMDRLASTNMSQFDKAMNQVKATMEALSVAIFTPPLEAFGEAVLYVTETMRGMHGETGKNIIKVVAFAGALGGALLIIPKIVAGVKAIVSALRAMAVGQSIVQALSGPAGWATLAASLAVAAGAAYAVDQAMGTLEADLGKTHEAVAAVAQSMDEATSSMDSMAESASEMGEAAAKVETDWASVGKRIKDSVMTPMEQYRQKVNEIKGAVVAGAISWETFTRASNAAVESLMEATKAKSDFNAVTQGVGAALAGTTAGFSAVQESRRADSERLRLEKQGLDEAKKQTQLLDQIRREVEVDLQIKEVRF